MTYTTGQVAQQLGVSRSVIRVYAARYRDLLSPAAAVGDRQQRNFSDDDVRLMAYANTRTAAGRNHAQVRAELAAGALDSFEWQPPSAPPPPVVELEEDQAPEAALVPVEQLRAALELLQDARRREEAAREEAAALRERVEAMALELGQARGALGERRQYRAPAWVRAVFGGRE